MSDISEVFYEISMRCGREHGIPLPQKVVVVGNVDTGWGVRLNPTNEKTDGLDPYVARVYFNGWPIGVVDPGGGCLVPAMEDTEGALIEWLKSDLVNAEISSN